MECPNSTICYMPSFKLLQGHSVVVARFYMCLCITNFHLGLQLSFMLVRVLHIGCLPIFGRLFSQGVVRISYFLSVFQNNRGSTTKYKYLSIPAPLPHCRTFKCNQHCSKAWVAKCHFGRCS